MSQKRYEIIERFWCKASIKSQNTRKDVIHPEFWDELDSLWYSWSKSNFWEKNGIDIKYLEKTMKRVKVF